MLVGDLIYDDHIEVYSDFIICDYTDGREEKVYDSTRSELKKPLCRILDLEVFALGISSGKLKIEARKKER